MERLYEAARMLRDNVKTQADIARVLNQSSQTVNNWEARGISRAGLLKAQSVLGVSATWLESGEGAMRLEPPGDVALLNGEYREVEMFNHGNPNVIPIPKVELKVSAGITGFSVDSDGELMSTYPLERSFVEANGFNQSRLVAMYVTGDSMVPNLKKGDLIIVNTADTRLVDGAPYVVNFDGNVVVKRMTRDAGEWWLTSDNPDPQYYRRIVRTNETFVIGKVVKRETTSI